MSTEHTADGLPVLPAEQRWLVRRASRFLIVKLQERRWWGWRTIASSTGLASGGRHELNECIDQIARRGYYARLRAEREAERRRRDAEIPYGIHPGKGKR